MADLKHLWKKRLPVIIGIAGGSGAGKTWLAHGLLQHFRKETCLISLDDFYRDRSHISPALRDKINFDHPRCIDWIRLENVLKSCIAGKKTSMPSYDFSTHSRREEEQQLSPRPLILVEGLWLLRRPSLRRLFDYKIFIECPGKLRFQRRIQRDCRERGRSEKSVRQQFQNSVEPMHQKFVTTQARWADVVFENPPTNQDIEQLAKKIKTFFAEQPL